MERTNESSAEMGDAGRAAAVAAPVRGLGAGYVAALGLLAALVVSWATRGPNSAFGIAEWTAAFTVALARDAWPAALYLLAGLGMGRWVRRILVRELSGALAACVGVSVLLTLSHLLGVLGLLAGRGGTVAAWLVIGLGLVGLLMDWRSVRSRVLAPRISMWHVPTVVLVLGIMVSATLAPPGWLWRSEFGGYDVLSYHLQLVQEWIAGGRLWPAQHNVYSFHPSYMEAGYYHLAVMTAAPGPTAGEGLVGGVGAWGLCAGDGWRLMGPQMLHASLAVVAAVLIAELSRRLVERADHVAGRTRDAREVGQGAGVLFLATPWIVVVGTLAYNEMGMMVMFAGAMLAAVETNSRAWVRGLLVGWLVGVACGCKATALLLVGTPVGVALAMWTPRRQLAHAFGAAALAGVVALSPWLIRNWLTCGNPVFPALTSVFGSGHWTSEQGERFARAHTFAGGWGERLALLVRADASDPVTSTHRGLAHPQWFVFFVLAIGSCVGVSALRRVRHAGLSIAVGVLAQLAVWLIATHVQSRFLIPLALGGSVAAGLCASMGRMIGGRLLAVVGLVQALALGVVYSNERNGAASALLPIGAAAFTGELPREAWRDADAPTRAAILEDASPEVYCGLVLPRGSRTLLVGGATPLYFAVETAYTTTWDTSELVRVMEEAPGEPTRWSALLAARGITHVLIDRAELDRLARSNFLDPRLDVASSPGLAEWMHTLRPMRVWRTGQVLADIRAAATPNGAPTGSVEQPAR